MAGHHPHVLFVMCDQMQGQRLGADDPVAYTPHLDRLAAEGVVVSVDKKTLAVAAWNRVARGLPMPGVGILRTLLTVGQAIN